MERIHQMFRNFPQALKRFSQLVKEKLDLLFNLYLKLNQREQKIILVGIPGVIVIGLIIIASVSSSHIHGLEEKLASRHKEIAKVTRLLNQYNVANRRQNLLERNIGRQQSNFTIFTFLESQASLLGIRDEINSMKEKPTPVNDKFKETAVEVKLQKITLSQLVNYLYNIENSPHLIRIKSLKVAPRYDNAQYLDVTFQVSTFEVIES